MRYAFSLFGFLSAYLLYDTRSSEVTVMVLVMVVVFSGVGMGIACCVSREWLNRYF